MLRVRAGRVLSVTAPPIEDGAVLVDALGRIAAVGPHDRVPAPPRIPSLEFPDGSLTPGLVNCHTHLELTHLAGRNLESVFPTWIRRVRELKDATAPDEFRAAAEAGVRDCWARGVTCVADTGSSGAALDALVRLGARGVCYQEVFGPDPAQCDDSLADLAFAVERQRAVATPLALVGVSPHAPFTVSEALYRGVVAFARREALPVALHLAESFEETALVREGTGPFAEALRGRGIAVHGRACSPVAYLAALGAVAAGTLCIHCVQLDAADVDVMARLGARVAHCPRSNAAHGHGRAPLAALRRAGVPVGLGTDSVVSVKDLDLRAEAAAAGLAGGDALSMLTLEGARALGLEREIGSLEIGKAADLAVFAASDRDEVVPRGPARLTVVAGRVVHQA